jgi:multicomponent K+:H+ antiporter subunit D
VLVVDRLSALMLVLASILAIPTLVFALARWHTAGRISTRCSSSC